MAKFLLKSNNCYLNLYGNFRKENFMENKQKTPNILIVDDEIGPRESLKIILKQNYNMFTAENGKEALKIIQQVKIDVATLDLKMPGLSGIETLKEIRRIDPDIVIIIITGYGTLKSAIEAIRYGVFDYIPKPFNVPEIVCILEKAINRRRLNLKIKDLLKRFFNIQHGDQLNNSNFFLQKNLNGNGDYKSIDLDFTDNPNYLEFAKVLAYTLEEKDPYTSGHSERVCYYSDFISKRLNFNSKDRIELQIASYLHDIGKIGISNRFINKKGALTSTDWAIIKQHTKKSIELLIPLNLSPNIISYIQHHHEHFDGTGYPDGLKGEQIPLGARIITVSDSYDSMTSERPYRKSLTQEEAKSELIRCSGKQFDPNLVKIFLDILKEMEEVFLTKDNFKVSSISF